MVLIILALSIAVVALLLRTHDLRSQLNQTTEFMLATANQLQAERDSRKFWASLDKEMRS